MKILLIDNNTVHKQPLAKALAGHDIEIQKYYPGLNFRYQDKDLVILSGGGGEGQEITDTHNKDTLWYQDEMKFVRTCTKPVIGICMGFEVMAKAHGQPVPHLGKLIYGSGCLSATEEGWHTFGKHQFKQLEAHRWHVPQTPPGFASLIESENGVEMMLHPQKRQLGTQFHPELGGSLSLDQLIQVLV